MTTQQHTAIEKRRAHRLRTILDQTFSKVTRIAAALATALAITAAIIAVALATSNDTDDWTRGYEPCATEDSAGPCYWDADTMGNGEGRSFVVEPTADGEGQVIYVNDAGTPDWVPAGYEPCTVVNSESPCYWDAEAHDDGDPSTFDGYSFLQHADGTFTRISPGTGIPLPTSIDVGK